MQKILVIIPTYNEVDNIGNVIDGILSLSKKLSDYRFDVLVLDDNSPDSTSKVIKSLQQKHSNIHMLSGPKKGLGYALIRGLKYSRSKHSFDICILMDGDMSHDPNNIPELIDKLNQGYDLVIGSRYILGGTINKDWPISRKLISRVANFTAHRLVGISKNTKDLTSGFKAIKSDALKTINLDSINSKGYVFEVSFLHSILANGLSVAEIPITFKDRNHGKSKLRLTDIIEFLYRSYKLNPNAPIQRFVRFGFVGASGTIVNLAVLSFMMNVIRSNAYISIALAIEISIISNFFLNHFYTFKGYGSFKLQKELQPIKNIFTKLIKFNTATLGGALISFISFSLLYKYAHLHYLLADIIAILLALTWNYTMSVRYIWKTIDKQN